MLRESFTVLDTFKVIKGLKASVALKMCFASRGAECTYHTRVFAFANRTRYGAAFAK
jgi:hypothetical protein